MHKKTQVVLTVAIAVAAMVIALTAILIMRSRGTGEVANPQISPPTAQQIPVEPKKYPTPPTTKEATDTEKPPVQIFKFKTLSQLLQEKKRLNYMVVEVGGRVKVLSPPTLLTWAETISYSSYSYIAQKEIKVIIEDPLDDQGGRIVCVSFGDPSAEEALIAKDGKEAVVRGEVKVVDLFGAVHYSGEKNWGYERTIFLDNCILK